MNEKQKSNKPFVKFASTPAERYFLRREASFLRNHTFSFVPRFMSFSDSVSGSAWLVMQHIDGVTLRSCTLTARERRDLIAELRGYLQILHSQGFIHGDIKPDNILINDHACSPVLIDWGAAQAIGEATSRQKLRQYSPGFSHPDLIFGRSSASIWWDFYAVDRLAEWLESDPAI